ncbi:MAG: DUF861 domain-containing protein [Mesorhizobium sp.]|nr:MAG: DUF861 domain-containing protein [Mesorhizobium sp.]
MTDFQTFAHLASIDLGEPEPKPTSISGDQFEASKTLWTSPDGTLEVGVLECTSGRFTASRDSNSETCHIVSGRVSLDGLDGRSEEVGPGEMLVLPKGWKGEWTIHEKTRKLYILHFEAT